MSHPRSIDRRVIRFGQIITRLRMKLGWTIVDLAKATGFHRTYIGHVEKGENNLTLGTMLRLARALDVQAWELLREAETGEQS